MVICNWDLPKRMWPGRRFRPEDTRAAMLAVAELGFRNRLPPVACLANGLVSWNWKGEGDTKYGFPAHVGSRFDSVTTGRLIDYLLERGANHFFIGFTSNIFARPAQAAERESRLRAYLTDYYSYLKSRNLLGLAYVYGVDEPWGAAVADAKRIYDVV